MAKRKNRQAEFVLWMGPILDALRELGDSGSPREVSDLIATKLKISDEKKEELMGSGTPRFHNQVCWARQYLVWEGLLSSEKRGIWQLTQKGRDTQLNEVEGRELFKKWISIHTDERKEKHNIPQKVEPEEIEEEKIIEYSGTSHRKLLLNVLHNVTPEGFEKLCKYILRVYGFENVSVTPKGKDGGIDGFGTLQLNPFVSFKVIFQCKRYQGTVSRAKVGDLRNAMIGRADKGIMITTGNFSEDAKKEAVRDGAPPIELIDAELLIDMMEKEEIGLKPKTVFDVDYSFFEQYM
ncbi:MAG: restriction endonuclease [Desulfamplus sp.]|nr:restriction endonuclease [Desulfamplus sp.]